MRPNYEWDAQKAKFNHQKHGIDFAEAVTAFKDRYSITIFDPDHSDIGLSDQGRKGAVTIEPDVLAYFPDAEAVNDALRTLIRLVEKPHKRRARKHEPSPNLP